MTVLIVTLILSGLLIWFFVWKYHTIKKLRDIRDNFDFTTKEGRFLIRMYNKKIDDLNGKNLFN